MKLLYKTWLIVLLVPVIAGAQIDYEVSGYVTDLPVYQKNNKTLSDLFSMDNESYLNINRIRIRPQIYIGDGGRINIEYEIASVYYNSFNLFNQVNGGTSNRQLFDLSWNSVDQDNFVLNHFIDRFYYRHGFSFGKIIIGRQRISWGTGRIWNPTDLFNPINPANFSKLEKDGADAVSFTYYLGSFTDLQLVYNPIKEKGKSNFGARFRTNYKEFDVSLIAGRFDERTVAGLDFAGNLFDAGIRGEGIFKFGKDDSDGYGKFILGADYQFTPELYALIEYQYNGEGKTDKLQYEFFRLINGEILNLNRNYFCVSGTYLLTPLLNLVLSGTFNLNDKSGYVSFTSTYSMLDNFDLGGGIQSSFGDDFTEYWYYPASLYLKCDYYF